jgi:cellulose synthase/poly-beta-1,6-N-acetylglucosamine synthase-like glycosyltransferase
LRSILRAGILAADIYVIDDGSSDNTGEIAARLTCNVVRNEKNIGKAHSLARLASVSELVRRYDYICLMDADTQVSKDYFQAVRRSLRSPAWQWFVAGQKHAA